MFRTAFRHQDRPHLVGLIGLAIGGTIGLGLAALHAPTASTYVVIALLGARLPVLVRRRR